MTEQTINQNTTAFETEVLTLGKRNKTLSLRLIVFLALSIFTIFVPWLAVVVITGIGLILCYIAFLEIKIYKLRKGQNQPETEEYKKVLKKIKWKTIGSAFLNIYLLGALAINIWLILEIDFSKNLIDLFATLLFLAGVFAQGIAVFVVKYFIEKYTFQLQEKYFNNLKMPQ